MWNLVTVVYSQSYTVKTTNSRMFASSQRETLYLLAVIPFSHRDENFKMWEIYFISRKNKLKEKSKETWDSAAKHNV